MSNTNNIEQYLSDLTAELPDDGYKSRFLEELSEHFDDSCAANRLKPDFDSADVLQALGDQKEVIYNYLFIMKSLRLRAYLEAVFLGFQMLPVYFMYYLAIGGVPNLLITSKGSFSHVLVIIFVAFLLAIPFKYIVTQLTSELHFYKDAMRKYDSGFLSAIIGLPSFVFALPVIGLLITRFNYIGFTVLIGTIAATLANYLGVKAGLGGGSKAAIVKYSTVILANLLIVVAAIVEYKFSIFNTSVLPLLADLVPVGLAVKVFAIAVLVMLVYSLGLLIVGLVKSGKFALNKLVMAVVMLLLVFGFLNKPTFDNVNWFAGNTDVIADLEKEKYGIFYPLLKDRFQSVSLFTNEAPGYYYGVQPAYAIAKKGNDHYFVSAEFGSYKIGEDGSLIESDEKFTNEELVELTRDSFVHDPIWQQNDKNWSCKTDEGFSNVLRRFCFGLYYKDKSFFEVDGHLDDYRNGELDLNDVPHIDYAAKLSDKHAFVFMRSDLHSRSLRKLFIVEL